MDAEAAGERRPAAGMGERQQPHPCCAGVGYWLRSAQRDGNGNGHGWTRVRPLARAERPKAFTAEARGTQRTANDLPGRVCRAIARWGATGDSPPKPPHSRLALLARAEGGSANEIGRASCRERV